MAERTGRLIIHKFNQYLLPSILLVFAMQFGSLANGMVIGQFVGADALSAASLSVSFLYLIQLPALAIPPGLAIVLGNLFSQRKFKDATRAFNATLVFGLVASFIFVPIGYFLIDPICSFLCGSFTEYIPYMRDYLSTYFYMSPLYFIGLLAVYVLSADNHPRLSSLFFVICAVVHIGVEIIFCLVLPKETVMLGVAWSGGIGMAAGLLVLIPYFLSKTRLLKFHLTRFSFSDIKGVLKAGTTMVFTFLLMFLMSILVMKTASTSFSDSKEMNTYVILTNMLFVVDLFVTGILQMLPSIVSALYGERDYSGIHFVVRRVLLLTYIVTGVLLAITLIYPNLYLLLFGLSEDVVSSDFALAVRLYSIAFFFYSTNKFVQAYYPGVFKNLPSLLNTFLQHGAAGIPLCVFLMASLGAKGFSIGTGLAEFCSLALTIVFVVIYGHVKLHTKSLLLLPKDDPKRPRVEMSVDSIESIGETKDLIKEKAISIGADAKTATILSLGAEELLLNSFEYGYRKRKKEGIDLRLSVSGEMMVLSLRDDGVAFDPTAYTPRDGPEGLLHGIPLIKSLATRLEYVRILNLNETIIEMDMSKKEAKA